MTKIALDAGHGINTAGKRTPDGECEWTFNNAVLLACAERLSSYQNVEMLRLDDPTGKTDVPLRSRTDKANAWRADALVSIHHNASTGAWHAGGGVETYVDLSASKASRDIAAATHPRIVSAMGLRDRGVKTANFHMTRESRMPAILTEGGFMDSTVDVKALRDNTRLKAQGYAIADGLATYFGIKAKYVAEDLPTIPEEVTRMFKPSSATLAQGFTQFLADAIKAGYISQKWADDYKDGKLTLDDALALKTFIDDARRK